MFIVEKSVRENIHAHMVDYHVQVFDDLHIVNGNVDGALSKLFELATVVADKGKGLRTVRVGVYTVSASELLDSAVIVGALVAAAYPD